MWVINWVIKSGILFFLIFKWPNILVYSYLENVNYFHNFNFGCERNKNNDAIYIAIASIATMMYVKEFIKNQRHTYM